MSRVRSCRVCGCTDDRACDGGCSWVDLDLCSACIEHAGEMTAGVVFRTWPLGTRYVGIVLDVVRSERLEALCFEGTPPAGGKKEFFLVPHNRGELDCKPGDRGTIICVEGRAKGQRWQYQADAQAYATVGGEDGHHGG